MTPMPTGNPSTPSSSSTMTSSLAYGSLARPSASHAYTAVQSAAAAHVCAHDNCLRQAIRSALAVSSFCASYTLATNTASAGFPGCLSACNNSPTRVSSACTCLATYTSSVAQASSTAASGTTTPSASSPISSPLMSSLYSTSSSSLTSATTTVYTTSSISQVSARPTKSTVPHPTKWITLPASDEIRTCAGAVLSPDKSFFHTDRLQGSLSCRNANSYYDSCMRRETDTEMWQCLCKTWVVG